METTNKKCAGLSVSTKISLGFSIVLALHISIAILGHYGLRRSQQDLATYDELHHQMERFNEIDRDVGALQRNVLLYAYTGYGGPELRVEQLQKHLGDLMKSVTDNAIADFDLESIDKMRTHLATHAEIFSAVIEDRAKRRKLVNQTLHQLGDSVESELRELRALSQLSEPVVSIEATFTAAQLSVLQFVNAPESVHVQKAKKNLEHVVKQIDRLRQSADAPTVKNLQRLHELVHGYETAVIQMVQATRGYLHLVNVVLAGESQEFRRLATDIRRVQADKVDQLSTKMAGDSERFQLASNIFSVLTILLGILAAWGIGRDVAPPLNAITSTIDGLANGKACDEIPALNRRDELGRLAAAAQVFKDRADETQRLLQKAKTSQDELNELNLRLETQTMLAKLMADEATAATKAKSEFLANMSHEIRTPMTAILGFAETVADNVNDEQNVDAINTIIRNGEHLLAIINDILDLSKVESGNMCVEHQWIDPVKVVAEVIDLTTVQADGAGLELKASFEGLIPESIQTDPMRLRQILINLVGNAIKFTEVGQVELIVRSVEHDGRSSMEFDIVDTGIGMSSDQVERLFKPFSQADTSTTRKFGGTGLGLTISKRFAQLLDGDLHLVETHQGQGTRFRATVGAGELDGISRKPARIEQAKDRCDLAANNGPVRLDGIRVLLAEDGPDNQRLLSFLLRKAGAKVQLAENGQLAMEAAIAATEKGTPFDCVLMDMQMPVMGGYEATRRLREHGYSGPILALTAHAMDGDMKKCLEAGCDDYLTKPVNRELLTKKVRNWSRQPMQVEQSALA